MLKEKKNRLFKIFIMGLIDIYYITLMHNIMIFNLSIPSYVTIIILNSVKTIG